MAIIKKFRIKSFKQQKPLVSLKKISLSFGKRQILDDISFNINRGEILGMLGPNGVGKSTIFNLITGLIKPDYGSLVFNNIDATNYPIYLRTIKFQIGYVPQHGGYFHDLTLADNLKNIKAKFLSGGQKKKLVISPSLLSNPKVLLLDECFAALDVLTIKMLQEIIVNLQQENQITICICDHQARDLLACVDIAMILSNCKIIAQDTPSNLVKDIKAKNAYFGNSFKFN